MKIGLDGFAIHPLNLDPYGQVNWADDHGFSGIQLGDIAGLTRRDDAGSLRRLRSHADERGLYTHVSVGCCNPVGAGCGHRELLDSLTRRIALAAVGGWHELHGYLGGPRERYELETPWTAQLEASTQLLRDLAHVLRGQGSRINLETHGDATTFELVRMVERVGPDVLGICLDTANVLLHGEHPVLAARRAAPYTHLTHCKDANLYFVDGGLRRQTLPPGAGIIDWSALVGELTTRQPEIQLTIEDHKWLFDAEIYTDRWKISNAEVPRDELLSVIELAWSCQKRIKSGELREPEDDETIPYGEVMEHRLRSGRDFLASIFPGSS